MASAGSRCLIAWFDGAILSPEWKDALWTCHGSATTTHAVRAAIQRSRASLSQLSKELGINPKTVAKWRKRATVEDLKTGPKGTTINGPDRSRGGDHPVFDAFGAASVPPAAWHLALA